MEDRDQRIPETSSLAVLYLLPLTQLLALSSDVDELLRDCGQFDLAWKKTIVRARSVLKIETERLGLVDSGVQTFLRSRGGQGKLVIEANRKMTEKAAEGQNLDAARKRASAQLAFLALSRFAHYGIDVSPLNLSDEEKSAVEEYFERPEPRRSDQSESNGGSTTVIASGAPAAALTRLLSESEPDVIALQRQLEGVSHQLTCRIARLSDEFERYQGQEEEKTRSRQKAVRLRVALVLESKRAKLMDRAIAGILRCLGGQQRLLIESAWRQHESPDIGRARDTGSGDLPHLRTRLPHLESTKRGDNNPGQNRELDAILPREIAPDRPQNSPDFGGK
jgi:hypothetical protein